MVWFLAGLMKRREDLVWVVGVSVRHDDDWREGERVASTCG